MVDEERLREKPDPSLPSWLPATTLVAIASTFAYLATFMYFCGYAEYFGIPTEWISINVISVFLAGSFCLALTLGPQSLTSLLRLFFVPHSPQPAIARRINALLYALFLFLCLVYLFDARFAYWGPGLLVLFIVVLFHFLFPLLTQRKTPGYLNKLAKQDELDAFWSARQDLGPSRLILPLPIYKLLVEGVVFIVAAYLVGRSVAMHKTDFLADDRNPAVVVLAIYPDKIVAGQVDLKTNKLTHRYWILPVTSSAGWEIKKIGRLTSK